MFDPRLDPACADARHMARKHADQRALLSAAGGQLASVVQTTQARQVEEHAAACARCRAFEPRCAACSADPRKERHGWLCPQQDARWKDMLPWNWRARGTPLASPQRTQPPRTDRTPPARSQAHLDPPVPRRPQADPHAKVKGSAEAHATPAAGARAARAPTTTRPSAPTPRAAAFATLKIPASASPEEIRAAFRDLAMQYHPDKVAMMAPEFRELAEQKMKAINAAYELLSRSPPAAPATRSRN